MWARVLVLLMVSVSAVSGCGGAPPMPTTGPHSKTASTPGRPPPPAPRGDGRLPDLARPSSQTVDLDLDPDASGFSGHVDIRLTMAARTHHIVLHAAGLRIDHAELRDTSDKRTPLSASLRKSQGSHTSDELVLSALEPIERGAHVLSIDFRGTVGDSLRGLYGFRFENHGYLATQFEPTDARRAFPCFDEPGTKIPYTLRITAPKAARVFANTTEERSSLIGRGKKRRIEFRATRPLPAYLVAFVVGPFEAVETRRKGVRIVFPTGHGAQTTLAREEAPRVLEAIESYVGRPYAYGKLDLVAVPEFAAGAMENPGLVTFRDELLLLDPKEATPLARRAMRSVIAHELAHQWFGNLVTAKWWDDIWLNEALATWMERKTMIALDPDDPAMDRAAIRTLAVLDEDALASARAIHQEVRSTAQARESFDSITYDKGAAILAMVESHVGEEKFHRGIAHYLEKHADRTATLEEFVGAIAHESGQGVVPIFESFVKKHGAPQVEIERDCRGARKSIIVRQHPFTSIGAAPPPRPAPTWTVPVCMKVVGKSASKVEVPSRCLLLDKVTQSVEFDAACDSPVLLNPELQGYMRVSIDETDTEGLVRARRTLDPREQIALLSQLWTSLRGGDIDADVFLSAWSEFADTTDPGVVAYWLAVLEGAFQATVPDDLAPRFDKWVAPALRRASRTRDVLAALPASGASTAESEARNALAGAIARHAPEILATRAKAIAKRFSTTGSGERAPVDVVGRALSIAARSWDASDVDVWKDIARQASLPETRILALRALGSVGAPDLLRDVLEFSLSDAVRKQDMGYILGAAVALRTSRPIVSAWTERSWERLTAKLSGPLARRAFAPLSAVCDREAMQHAEAFYGPRARHVEGAEHGVREAFETARLCADLRAHHAQAIERVLAPERAKD